MITQMKKFFARGVLALCLATGFAADTIEPAAAAPMSAMAPAVSDSAPALVQHVQYRRHYVRRYRVVRRPAFYVVRHRYRPVYRPMYRPMYRPIYRPVCRRVVGWHQTRFGMIFGPYNRCYR